MGVELDSLQNPQNAIVAHRLGDKTLPLELQLESDGFRRFYAHLLALYQMPPKQTLVFEEPENGIYPGALELLADEFKAAPDDNRGQVLLTTHSPTLLDHFSAAQIRVVELENLETCDWSFGGRAENGSSRGTAARRRVVDRRSCAEAGNMSPKRLVLLVEGQGDVEAAPVLVGRFLKEYSAFDAVFLDSHPPFRVGEFSKLVKGDFGEWRRLLQAAVTTRKNVGGCILLLDGDSPHQVEKQPFCAMRAARRLAAEAQKVGAGSLFSVAIVFACMEFESWLIGGVQSLVN